MSMPPATPLSPSPEPDERVNAAVTHEVNVAHELHTYRGTVWYRVKRWPSLRDAMIVADQVLQAKMVDGIRVARTEGFPGYGFSETVIVFKQMLAGIAEADPLAPAYEPDEVLYWRKVEDFYHDWSREEFWNQLGRYFEDKRVTALELIHSDRHMVALDQAGTILQGMIQKIAVAQAQTDKASAPSLFKDLMSLFSQLTLRLRTEAGQTPVPLLEPGTLGQVLGELERRFEGEARPYQIYRTFTALLVGAKTWTEKLDRLGRLFTPDLEVGSLRYLDMIVAEQFRSDGLYRELLPEKSGREALLTVMIDFHGGAYRPETIKVPPGVGAISSLIADGCLPRTRSTLRRRLLRELHQRNALASSTNLMAELESLHRLIARLPQSSPALARDEEISEAFDLRAGRAITSEGVGRLLETASSAPAKLDLACRFGLLVPGAANRTRFFNHFRAVLPADDLVRQTLRLGVNRVAALGGLIEAMNTLIKAPFDEGAKTEMMATFDQTVLDILKNDVVLAAGRSYFERIVLLVRICTTSPPPAGNSLAFASELIGRELKNPKFLPAYIQRFKTDDERKQAMGRLRDFITTTGRTSG
ncbi:putative TIR domain-containing protein [uncultured Gammaproteobacteria bacterium]